MEAYIQYKQKQRPLTSKPKDTKQSKPNKPRPETTRVRAPSAINKDLKTKNCGNDMKSYRIPRARSAVKDKYYNKFWEDTSTMTNVIHASSSKLVIKRKEKNSQERQAEERKLYNFDKLEWDQKKTFNFLTNVGGIEINRNNFNFIFDSTMNSTLNTDKFISRPVTAVGMPVIDRPYTTTNKANKNMPRITSGISEALKDQKTK